MNIALDPGDLALVVDDLSVRYGATSVALEHVSLSVPKGRIVSLLGPNGAGKSTVMRAVSGLLGVHGGSVISGRVELLGADVTRARSSVRVKRGLAQALEGRQVFPDLTVAENLASGAYVRRYRRAQEQEVRERVLHHFPRLADLMDRKAGYLSGGEQQMLAIGRALMSRPSVLLLDEPSLGLAPKIVETVRDVIVDINREGTSILLVEQNAAMALSIAAYGYVLEGGRVVKEGPADALRCDEDIAALYLGMVAADAAGKGLTHGA
ncbi:ABC transporter ATP-binding protein [Pseudonocardia hispaniensis]|uniref:ABC transporter ATP-binding protein n=1 Tax=Pseudonocardia hispaniensis TaxID=904933 RepID=A0ABW1J801_9PSEU